MTTMGTMDFDFRKRCVINCETNGLKHQRVIYGLSREDYEKMNEGSARDLGSYGELSEGGRLRSCEERHQHFFSGRVE